MGFGIRRQEMVDITIVVYSSLIIIFKASESNKI